jgi:hypothetical protein
MKGIYFISAVMLICVGSVFADDSISQIISAIPLPAWAKGIISLLIGGGVVGGAVWTLIKKILSKFVPWAEHALNIIKTFSRAITKIKPILQDPYVVDKYGNLIADYNNIVDETELLFNSAKLITKQDFLEKYKVEAIDPQKVIKALKISPVVSAANEALKQL